MTNFQMARLLFKSPTRAFANLKEAPVFALPMWIALIGTASVGVWYYSVVDISWLQDQLLTGAHIRPTAQQFAAAHAPGARTSLLWTSSILAPVGSLMIAAIGALYLLLAGSLTKTRYSYRYWFAFTWWVATPTVVALIPTVLILAFSTTTQISSNALQPLSLNELLLHMAVDAPGYNLLSNFGLVQLAQASLAYVGLRVWSGRSASSCLVLVLLPMVLLYGAWAFISFR